MHAATRVGVGYNIQIAVDAKHKPIAEQQVYNKVSDLGLLAETAVAARRNLAVDRIDAIADAGYFKIEDIEACENTGVVPHVPKSKRQDIFFVSYAIRAACKECQLKSKCTKSASVESGAMLTKRSWSAWAERLAARPELLDAMEWTPPSDGVISARKERTWGAFDQRRRRPWTRLPLSESTFRRGVSNSMGRRQRQAGLPQNAFAGEVPCISLRSAAVPDCDGGLRRCASLGSQIIALGHACKLIPPIYVKPFLKRQKNDSNDAAAIVEAAQRPTMRFCGGEVGRSAGGCHVVSHPPLLVRQRTQTSIRCGASWRSSASSRHRVSGASQCYG